jgi:nucleoside-diphosphate-sugar epimerase
MIFGDGEQTRDFVFVDDVVQANVLAGSVKLDGWGKTAVYNVGRGEQTSLNQIVAVLGEINGRKIPTTYKPARHGDIKHSAADITRIQHDLGFTPQTTLQDGLRQTLAWFQGESKETRVKRLGD